MKSAHLFLASCDWENATALVPALVPDTWTGAAARACQRELDDVRALVASVTTLWDDAFTAVDAVTSEDTVCRGTP